MNCTDQGVALLNFLWNRPKYPDYIYHKWDDWDSSNPAMCSQLIKHIIEKMVAFNAPFLYCNFIRESYSLEPDQIIGLKKEIEDFISRHDYCEVKYASTSDIMAVMRLSQKQFEEEGCRLLSYFSELLISIPKEHMEWDDFLRIFHSGHQAHQMQKVRTMSEELILISTDEALIQVYTNK